MNISIKTTVTLDLTRAKFSLVELIVIYAVFTLITLLNTIGNILVITVVLNYRKLRSVTNYFFVNLSLMNIISIFHTIPNTYLAVSQNWNIPFGLCIFLQVYTLFSVSVCALTFYGISGDRYKAIIYPFLPKTKSRVIIGTIIFIWIISFIIALPLGIYSDDRCEIDWKYEKQYQICFIILMYVCPLFVLMVTYAQIVRRLWLHKFLGEVTQNQKENIRSKKKVVKMLLLVIGLFSICAIPYQIVYLSKRYLSNVLLARNVITIYLFSYGLFTMQSVVNPIIYFTMNKRFKTGLKMLFKGRLPEKPNSRCIQVHSIKTNDTTDAIQVILNTSISNKSHLQKFKSTENDS